MTNLTLGRAFPSSFVGFDRLFNDLERIAARQEPTYPPHNIVKVGDDKYIIELAVAGYRKDELSIDLHEHVLTIHGNKAETEATHFEVLHKGISSKKFKRSFTLNEHVEVQGSNLEDGILSIYLERIVPDEKKPRTIEIGYQAPMPELLNEAS
jgi:molecular chaperone IbpA